MNDNVIRLYWFKHKGGCGNFGDELNPYLIKKLSDSRVVRIDISLLKSNRFSGVKRLVYRLIKGQTSFRQFGKYLYYNVVSRPQVLLAIGSVLQFSDYDNILVWGSGIIARNKPLPKGNFLAVRGYRTINKIIEVGSTPPLVVGDPAILLSKLYKPKFEKKYKIGIIPHYKHYSIVNQKFKDKEVIVINLLDPIEKIIDEIAACEMTISTSLHGIIVSHTYGIDSLWADYGENALSGDNVKFQDYFSSVGINDYDPVDITIFFDKPIDFVLEFISLNFQSLIIAPEEKIFEQIQLNLLKSFPFKLKNIWQENIEK